MTYTGTSSDSSYGLLMSSPFLRSHFRAGRAGRAGLLRLAGAAEQLLARVRFRRGDAQVLERRSRLLIQVLRHDHLDGREQRAERPVLAADAAAGDAEHLSVRRAWRDAHGNRGAAVGRHLDLSPERKLGHRHRHRHREVVAGSAEHRVRRHVDPHVQVSRLAAVLAGRPLAGDPDPLAVGHARRDARLDGARAHRPPAAAARRARVLDHEAAAAAGLAGLGETEPAEVTALLPGATAVRADLRHRAGLGAGPVTDGARPLAGEPQRHRGAVDRVAERQVGLRLDVRAAPRPAGGTAAAGTTAAEDPADHVAQALAAEQVAEVEVPGSGAGAGPIAGRHPEPAEHRAGLVVLLALLLVRHHVVRFGDLLEALLGVGAPLIRVGVILPSEFAIGLFDLGRGRGLGDAQRLVVVLLVVLRAHLASPGSSLVIVFSG